MTWMKDDEEAIDYLQRLGGMCLTGDTTSRVFPIFWGKGKNGKNVFLDTLMGLLGDYAMAAPRTLLTQSYNEEHATEIAGLMGRRLVIASETKPGRKLKTSLVKSMTGDKRIRGRFMRQDYFEFDVTHKTILMTQNLPIIDEVTDAIWDRLHRVEWGVRIPDDKQDHHLLQKLEAEWSLILGWFVEGCLKWQQDGYLKPTEAIVKGTKEYRADMNPLKDFLDECCIKEEGNFSPVTELKKEFDIWDTDKKKMSAREFNSYMIECGYTYKLIRVGGKPVKCWLGLRLRDNSDE
jgi:P4 family phage/plasmid primase-like protien